MTGHRRRRRQPADSQPVAIMRDTLILHVNCALSLSSRVMAPASNHFPLLHPCKKCPCPHRTETMGTQNPHTLNSTVGYPYSECEKHTVSALWVCVYNFVSCAQNHFLAAATFITAVRSTPCLDSSLSTWKLTWPMRKSHPSNRHCHKLQHRKPGLS